MMNFDPLKHNSTFKVPLMYLRILLTIFQCSLIGFAMNRLAVPTAGAMSSLAQITTNIKLATVDAYGVRNSFILSSLLLGFILRIICNSQEVG